MIINILLALVLGFGCGLFSAYGLYLVIRQLGFSIQNKRLGITFTVVCFLLKFPLVFMGAYFCFKQGIDSLAVFTTAVMVVYFAMVWRAYRVGFY